jgi:predicted membrane channel-forming protein YqfA (hemolysin III family)
MTLEDRDIVQINATIIAGALIFLTISSVAFTHEERVTILTAIGFSLGLLLLFSISSIYATTERKDLSIQYMKIGFGYFIFVTLLLIAVNVVKTSL